MWLVYIIHCYSYLADELRHPAESGVSKASAFCFVSRTVCSPYPTLNLRRPSFCSRRSGTVFRSISHLLRHLLSSALAWRHTSSNSVTRNYCCRAREVTLSFMDMLNRSYLLTYSFCNCIPVTDWSIYMFVCSVVSFLFIGSQYGCQFKWVLLFWCTWTRTVNV